MKPSRILLVGLLVTLSSALPALSQASPPDPSWIRGVYDDADYDDVVTLVIVETGNILPEVPVELRFVPRWLETPTFTVAAPEIPRAAADRSRAPPAS
jgi:hypothetical protein